MVSGRLLTKWECKSNQSLVVNSARSSVAHSVPQLTVSKKNMNTLSSWLPAIFGLIGTVVGAISSIVGSYLIAERKWRQQQIDKEIDKRESLYSEFLSETSILLLDSMDNSLGDKQKFVGLYNTMGRISMLASPEVIDASEELAKYVIRAFKKPDKENSESDGLSKDPRTKKNTFTGACRAELEKLKKQC